MVTILLTLIAPIHNTCYGTCSKRYFLKTSGKNYFFQLNKNQVFLENLPKMFRFLYLREEGGGQEKYKNLFFFISLLGGVRRGFK